MTKLRSSLAGIALSTVLVAGGLTVAAPAGATEQTSSADAHERLATVSPTEVAQAIAEADAAGLVTKQMTAPNGAVSTTIDLGDGFVFDLIQPTDDQRIGVGTDTRGIYVSFNATDQNMIISGAAFGLGAGLCAAGGPAFCVITGAIITMATVAITGSGAIRCGTRALRVYPFAGGRVKPRCA